MADTQMIAPAPLSGALGAEMPGVELATLDEAGFAAVYRAFLEHQVLVFRDQALDPAAYLAVARRFGDPAPYPFARGMDGFPEITPIIKEADQTSNFGGMWHADTTYLPAPPKAAMLLCVETPETGGDTVFSCQYKAHDALSPGLRAALAGLRGVSSSDKNAATLRGAHLATGSMQGSGTKEVLMAVHPVVRVHPETGRRALFVNRSHTVAFDGWTAEESAGLLAHVFERQIQPEFTARVRWRPGTVVIWDNRSTQHCAINDYDGHRREMWRVSLAGDAPKGP